jgi:hypothetical protein
MSVPWSVSDLPAEKRTCLSADCIRVQGGALHPRLCNLFHKFGVGPTRSWGVIARSATTKQSPSFGLGRLLRFARNDSRTLRDRTCGTEYFTWKSSASGRLIGFQQVGWTRTDNVERLY